MCDEILAYFGFKICHDLYEKQLTVLIIISGTERVISDLRRPMIDSSCNLTDMSSILVS